MGWRIFKPDLRVWVHPAIMDGYSTPQTSPRPAYTGTPPLAPVRQAVVARPTGAPTGFAIYTFMHNPGVPVPAPTAGPQEDA